MGSQKTSRIGRKQRSKKLCLELLEARQLLAADCTVTTTADTPTGTSLRGCVNSSATADTIDFHNSLNAATISLNPVNGPIFIDQDLTIDASSLSAGVTVDGNHNLRLFQIFAPSLSVNIDVTMRGLTFARGDGTILDGPNGQGGAIFSAGTNLTLDNTIFRDNFAGFGGAISAQENRFVNTTTVRITDSRFENNSAGIAGGAIASETIEQMEIDQTSFVNNVSAGDGGAIRHRLGLTLTRSELSFNSAATEGGAINIRGASPTIYPQRFENNTFHANTAGGAGGAVNWIGDSSGGANIINNTITGSESNGGGAIAQSNSGALTLHNNIVYGNTDGGGATADVSGSFNPASSNNVIGSLGSTGIVAGNNLVNVNPNLGPLQLNGGLTRTRLPQLGSPAIDAGNGLAALPTDQRVLPRIVNSVVDIGAVEFGTSIHGQKWHDLDGDGMRDPDEPGLDGWTIEVVDSITGAVVATQVTHSMDLDLPPNGIDPMTESGLYWIDGLAAGNYLVREVAQTGWAQTSPATSVAGHAIADNWFQAFRGNATGSNLTAISPIHAGPNVNAHPINTTTIDEYLYFSAWGDDQVAQGFVGEFQFNGPQGTTLLTGDASIEVCATGEDYDTQVGPSSSVVQGYIGSCNLQSGWQGTAVGPTDGVSFPGLIVPNPLIDDNANWIWNDTGNQVDVGAPFVGGFDHDEFLIFRVPVDPGAHSVSLELGQSVEGQDFGNTQLASIHGKKFWDVNRNGVFDQPEVVITGGVEDDFALTNNDEVTTPRPGLAAEIGNPNPREPDYDGQTPNTFFIDTLSLPAGLLPVQSAFVRLRAKPLVSAGSENDAIHFFAGTWGSGSGQTTGDGFGFSTLAGSAWNSTNFPTGMTFTMPLTQLTQSTLNDVLAFKRLDIYAQDDTSIDFVELHLLTSEPCLADWPIKVNGTDGMGNPVSISTTTMADGQYWIEGLMPGSYTVSEGTVPGWVQTAPASGTHTVNLRSGDVVTDVDFGNYTNWVTTDPGKDLPSNMAVLDDFFVPIETGQVIDFSDVSGEIPSDLYLASHGVLFDDTPRTLRGVYPEDGNIVETLDGYDGTYHPDGDNVLVVLPNHLEPFTISFVEPVSAVGSFVGMGDEGTIETLTIEAFDVDGNLLVDFQARTALFDDGFNREGYWGIQLTDAVIKHIRILNDNDEDFGNALIVDDLRWDRPTGLPCDFNGDAACDVTDLDLLTTEIVAGTQDLAFDLNGDGQVTLDDIEDGSGGWLRLAGEQNLGAGKSYLSADLNLDGFVDGADFVGWNANKFSATGLWSLADFDASGFTDGQDFIKWNENKFQSSDGSASRALPSALHDQRFAESGRGDRAQTGTDLRLAPGSLEDDATPPLDPRSNLAHRAHIAQKTVDLVFAASSRSRTVEGDSPWTDEAVAQLFDNLGVDSIL